MSWKNSLKGLQKTLTLSAQITQIDTIINMLTKRKHRLLKRMGIGKDGKSITKKEEN
jgi:CRISPR/Cas system CSM-associated protein Csm4 (group 5 of RAMP superfamily)